MKKNENFEKKNSMRNFGKKKLTTKYLLFTHFDQMNLIENFRKSFFKVY